MEVYLCVSKNNYDKYTCQSFNDFVSADNYYRNIDNRRFTFSTMIRVYSFAPMYLKKKYLQYRLSEIFCKTEIKKI